jgi:hypothetical protein
MRFSIGWSREIDSNECEWFDRLSPTVNRTTRPWIRTPSVIVAAGLSILLMNLLRAEELTVSASDELVLVGDLTRAEIERALPDWVEEQVTVTPDPTAAASLAVALEDVEVTVYLGTWCADSRRELARLWRALDLAAAESPTSLHYIGVDRPMIEPRAWTAGRGLERVPTFVVERESTELGRIVEISPNGIEIDLLALLRGETSGVITASDFGEGKDED